MSNSSNSLTSSNSSDSSFSIVDIICCPNCQSDLITNDNKNFTCSKCNSSYREKGGIIILISKELEDELRS